jgi:hypothetical protein
MSYDIQTDPLRKQNEQDQICLIRTSKCGTWNPVWDDTCFEKERNLGAIICAAGPPSEPNSLNLQSWTINNDSQWSTCNKVMFVIVVAVKYFLL